MIELRVLGGVELRSDGSGALTGVLAQPKRFTLLAYLALTPGQSFRRRDSIAALFWPDQDQEHARGSLRQAIRFLRRELGDAVIRNRGAEEIGIDPQHIWCDAIAFERAVDEGDSDEALRLYRGGLLEGYFVADAAPELDEWLETERGRLAARAGDATWKAVEALRVRGELPRAIALARGAVRRNPDDEAGVRRLLVLCDAAGDRAAAIAAYEEFAQRLREEYATEPAAETQRLMSAIRTRSDPHAAVATAIPLTIAQPTRGRSGTAAPAVVARYAPVTLVFAALLALGIAGTALALMDFKRGSAAAGDAPLTVAVLPVRDLSADTTGALLAEAATDELITDLAQIAALRVINRRTMMLYRDSTAPPERLAQSLRAGAVVITTLQRTGDNVVLRAQLVLAGDPRVAWAQSFSGGRQEVFGWLQEVARSVAGRVSVELTANESAGLAARRQVDPEAFEMYAKGRWWWNKRGRVNLQKADTYFHQALDREPTYALAWSGLADTYAQMGYGGFLPPDEAFLKAKAMARRALELDSTLAEPHAALAYSMMYYDWDWEGAEREFRHAVRRNPSYATAHEWYGLFLAAMGRFEEAEREAQLAQALDPLSAAVAATRGWILHYAGKQEEALRVLRGGMRTDSTNGILQLYLGRVHQYMGRYDSATAHYAATGTLRAWIPTVAGEGTVAALRGRRPEATHILRQLDSLRRTGEYVTPYAVALVHAALGDRDSAFALLEDAYRDRTHWLVWLNRDSRWATLRNDPRFADLVRRMRLPP